MTKDTSTASTAADGRASSTHAAGGGSSDGGAAAEDAQASVLAQHELTKVGFNTSSGCDAPECMEQPSCGACSMDA
jgi:hypothetical protein